MNTKISAIELRLHSPQSLLALIEGEEVFQRIFGLRVAEGLRSFFVSGEVSLHWLAQLREARQSDPWTFGFAVVDQTNALVVGSAGFKGPPDAAGAAEVAYGIVPAFEGKGYATEALGELVRFAFNDERVRKLCAHTLPVQNASSRVLAKNGFTKTGEVVDPDDGPVWRWERNKNGTSS
ncbi:MAG: GNAT family N-acetyltransferase [Verrucomicrobiota bacterium]